MFVAQPDVFIAWMGMAAYPTAIKLARRLRDEGFCVELPYEEKTLTKLLGFANKLGSLYVVIIGENEVASGLFTVKRMADAEQRKLNEADIVTFLHAAIAFPAPTANWGVRCPT